jgi:DNA polymerase-3 subunit beta
MTTTVRKDLLSKAVGTVVKAVGANPVLPLLSNILFESANGSSRVAATNLEIGIGYTFPSKGKKFKTCIPAKTISSLVEALHSDEVDLELDPKNQSITVMTETSTSNIHCAPADEFPDIPGVEEPSFTMSVTQFKEMVQRVAFASSATSDSVLGGVQISIERKKMIMFAVDGFHFSYEETALTGKINTENTPFIIKGTTLEMISRILPEEGELQVQVGTGKVMFHSGSVDVITQLLQGEFPDHKRLGQAISEPSTTLSIPTMELLRAARQIRVFASETGKSKLAITGMLMRYSTITQEKGDADITFAAIKKGKDVEVGINVHLLHEFLEVCKTEYVTVELVDKNSPIVFKMKGFDTFYHVIMPIVL